MSDSGYYYVWRSSESEDFKVYTWATLEKLRLAVPSERDPNLIYAGDNYAEAEAVKRQANAVRGNPAGLSRLRTAHRPQRETQATRASARKATEATGSLF